MQLDVATSRLSSFCLALFLTYASAASADDTEIYFTGLVEQFPNVLFVLDRSGSMGNMINPTDERTKLQELQIALKDFISTAERINVGIMTYSGDVVLEHPLEPIDTIDQEALGEVIDAIPAAGSTATLLALDSARKYFSGEFIHNVEEEDPNNPDAPPTVVSTVLDSPISHECQQNNIVLLTDGSPTRDEALVMELEQGLLREMLEKRVAEGSIDVPLCKEERVPNQNGVIPAEGEGNGNCGAELANYMFTNDLRPDDLAGSNTVETHTIGFDFEDSSEWLPSLSNAMTGGGGFHYDVDLIAELTGALNDAFEAVSSASFAAPTVSTDSFNQSRHRDELYFAPFKPTDRVQWTGNFKKYRLSVDTVVDADGNEELVTRIVDVNGEPIVGDDGSTVSSSQSFWADAPDGADVADGGFAENLNPGNERFWYTDFNATSDVNNRLTPVRVTEAELSQDHLTNEILQVGSNARRYELIDWILQPDVLFEDSNDNIVTRSYVADSLHGTPQLLTYNSSTTIDPNVRTEVLYAATNLGMLHAIDPLTGRELWSYTPEEHLPNIRRYFDNPRRQDGKRVYGLDGEILITSTRAESVGFDFEVDKARLYMTERRGGNRVYGLDITNGDESLDPFKVLWKITGGVNGTDGFEDLAQTWSKPELINVRYGCPDDCEERELLLFGGGYNAAEYDDVNLDFSTLEGDGNTPESGHGNAVYLVDPETGERVWSVGNGSAGDNQNHDLNLPLEHSIPSTPVPVDTNLDGFVDLLFFVDLSGDVWRVDLSRGESAQDVVHLSGGQIAELAPAGQSLRFFNPLDVSISGFNATTSNFFLVTGSGMRNSPLFPEPDNNRLYAIADRNIQRIPTDYRYVEGLDGNENSIITADDNVIRNVEDPGTTTSVFHGFYRSFPPGEKVLVPTATSSFRVRSSTYVPPNDVATEGCSGPIGSSRLYVFDLPNGENSLPDTVTEGYFSAGDGIQGSGVLIDTGQGDAPHLLFDNKVRSLKEIIVGAPEVYRKFQRTGWVEQDGY